MLKCIVFLIFKTFFVIYFKPIVCPIRINEKHEIVTFGGKGGGYVYPIQIDHTTSTYKGCAKYLSYLAQAHPKNNWPLIQQVIWIGE